MKCYSPVCGWRKNSQLRFAIHYYFQLITNQASEEYMAKHMKMIHYLDKVQELLKAFITYSLTQVPWMENAHIDALENLGSVLHHQFRCSIFVEHNDQSSTDEVEPEVMHIDTSYRW